MHRGGWRVLLLRLALLLAGAGCQSDIRLVDPTEGGRSGLTIRALIEDTALARELGWEDGVPRATVSLRWSLAPPIEAETDSLGSAIFPGLPARTYWIAVERRLGDGNRLPGEPHVLGGGAIAGLSPGEPLLVGLRADDPGALVISEYYYHPISSYALNYFNHGYLELYNNSDTTIYLDGKIVGSAFNYNFDASLWRCTETAPMRIVEGGVYAQFLNAFPGSGREHPLAPGGTVLIADQAIDHSALYPELADLSSADFEFGFPDRADNPAVPNMLDVGLVPMASKDTRFVPIWDVAFLATPLALGPLPRATPKYQGEFALIPGTVILDIASFIRWDAIESYTGTPLCTEGSVHPSLDRRAAWTPSAGGGGHLLAAHRKREAGSRTLQRTRTSAVDFELGPRSPGRAR